MNYIPVRIRSIEHSIWKLTDQEFERLSDRCRRNSDPGPGPCPGTYPVPAPPPIINSKLNPLAKVYIVKSRRGRSGRSRGGL